MRHSAVIIFISTLLAIYGCSTPENKVVITVLDDATRQPIPDVWVSVARIQYAITTSVCIEALSEKSGADGKANFAPKSATEFYYYAYKPGYSVSHAVGNTIYLKQATGSPHKRLHELYNLSFDTACSEQGKIKGNIQMHEAIANEALPLASRLIHIDKSLPLEPQISQADSACFEMKMICQNMGDVAFGFRNSKWSVDWVEDNSPECFAMLTCPRQVAGKNCAVRHDCGEFCWSGAYVTHCNEYGDHCSTRFEPLTDNQGYQYPHAPECPGTSMGFISGGAPAK